MAFKPSTYRALVVITIILSSVNCQDTITKPAQFSLVTKGQDYPIEWSLIAPLEVSNVSITLMNPNTELGGLSIIASQLVVAIGDRGKGSGLFLYYYKWVPDERLETSDTYQIRIVDGGVTLESQSFYIGSVADVTSKGSRNGTSAAVVGGAVGGALVGVILIGIAVVFYMMKRKGWTLTKKPNGVEQGEVRIEGSGEIVNRPAEIAMELEGSLGKYEYFNQHNSELPGSTLEGAVSDLIQQQQEDISIARRPSMFKSDLGI